MEKVPNVGKTYIDYIKNFQDPSIKTKTVYDCAVGIHPGMNCHQYKVVKFKAILINTIKL